MVTTGTIPGRRSLTALLMSCLCVPAMGAERSVELEVASGLTAVADYWQGEANMPAVLIAHGFLQTRGFPTVRRLAASLADSGYSVLAPSLTLGIDRRAKSLACEAIHTHSMQQDIAEIDHWVNWLHRESGKPPILIGHSAGSIHTLAYLSAQPRDQVASAILISITYFGRGPAAFESPEMAERARQAIAAGAQNMDKYALAFCRDYITTAKNYLSYYEWSKKRAENAAAAIMLPLTLIVGSADDRIDQEWVASLTGEGMQVRVVDGANHFFDQEHEFDLLEQVEGILE